MHFDPLDVEGLRHRIGSIDGVRSKAIFSADERYRYSLLRRWNDDLPLCTFIMLNPSTATEAIEDPTVRRTQFFARREDCGGIHVLNIFAFRARWPGDMARQADPIGPHNNLVQLLDLYEQPSVIICAWGNNGALRGRSTQVLSELAQSSYRDRCFSIGSLSKHGEPKHPLYLPSVSPLSPLFP